MGEVGPIVFGICNQKGGVGKTTTAVTLADGLARKGFSVLLVDLDPQGHVAVALGYDKAPGLYRVIVEEASLRNVILRAWENLDILPGDKRTEKAKRYIASLNFRERVLADLLKDCDHDLVILDMAPSLDVLHVAALVASDWVIIPSRLDALAVDGVNEVLRSIGEVASQGHRLGYSLLPTFFDRTTRETAVQLRGLVKAYTVHVWPPIPQDTRVREASAYGQTLWEYSPGSAALVGYAEGKSRIGGYQKTLERVMEIVSHGKNET